jgi:anion-transporting  ArsA/GET3 family ATPase
VSVHELQKLRSLLVTGKGGVGKTTIAGGLARLAAARGLRTLAVEVVEDDDRDAPLAASLGLPVLREEPTEVAQRLHVAALSPSIGHRAFLRDTLPVRMLADAALKSQAVRRFLNAAPTFPEMGVLYRLLDLSRARRSDGSPLYEHIIVDLPATGHALALVQVPAAVLRVVPGGAIGQAVRTGLELLCDPAKNGAIVVTLPEPLPVSESLELVRGLEASDVAVPGVVLNRVPHDPFAAGELEIALELVAKRATLGAKSVQRIARARQARARLEETRPVLLELPEHEDDPSSFMTRWLAEDRP